MNTSVEVSGHRVTAAESSKRMHLSSAYVPPLMYLTENAPAVNLASNASNVNQRVIIKYTRCSGCSFHRLGKDPGFLKNLSLQSCNDIAASEAGEEKKGTIF